MKLFISRQGVLLRLVMIMSIFSFISLSSCSKDDIENNDSSSKDLYYVKYVISTKSPYIFSNWSVTTPDGIYSKYDYQTRRWEETYGPVKKGFKCEGKVSRGEPTVQIYVSKNQEPFALKASKTISASYTIDF